MTVSMPQFSFKKIDTSKVSEADFESSFGKGENKFLQPGRHTLKILKAEFVKQNETDSNWGNFKITFVNSDGKEAQDTILVPLASEEDGNMAKYRKNGKEIGLVGSKYRQFMAGLGHLISLGNWQAATEKVWGNPSKSLVNQTVELDIGYNGNHTKFLSKDADGTRQYVIVDKNDVQICDVVFPDYQAAGAYYLQNPDGSFKGELVKFANVTKYHPRPAQEVAAKEGFPF